MTESKGNNPPLWRRCEIAWANWLEVNRWTVVSLCESTGEGEDSSAPLIRIQGERYRAPDFEASKPSGSLYWEVKSRTRPEINSLTGEREHWMERAAAEDYWRVAQATGKKVWIALYESDHTQNEGAWLQCEIGQLFSDGRFESRISNDGSKVNALIWPRSVMKEVKGCPAVDETGVEYPILPDDTKGKPISLTNWVRTENELRKRPSPTSSPFDEIQAEETEKEEQAVNLAINRDNETGLDVLRRSLGIPTIPRYSVLRVGSAGIELPDLIGLLQYGIRVFLITDSRPESIESEVLNAFESCRLLEWAVVPQATDIDCWIVDGKIPDELAPNIQAAMTEAETKGQINMLQYHVVHADFESDVIVSAGAGTGKTETMAERALFLLATTSSLKDEHGTSRPYDLKMNQIALVTFTREAAHEMRERLARTLSLRQRLCRRCVLPALPWMMQLSSTEISTIHSFAKSLIIQSAGILGISPQFRVAKQTIKFRELLYRELSSHLEKLFTDEDQAVIPAVHLWREHLEVLWDTLDNNGIDLMAMGSPTAIQDPVDWGQLDTNMIEGKIADSIRATIKNLGASYAEFCIEAQSLPTSKLVTTALRSLREQKKPPVRTLHFVFVDEFQDTDTEQMDLMLEIRKKFGSRLFVVGDVKQGIYRFRGAEGSAFKELKARFQAEVRLEDPLDLSLNRNFRAGLTLLDSLHPYFKYLGEKLFLDYTNSDRLEPNLERESPGEAAVVTTVNPKRWQDDTVNRIRTWKSTQQPLTIAVLCRENWMAMEAQVALRANNISCELLVGGDFYKTPAVRDLRVFLEAATSPDDHAALLELCESRWAEGILSVTVPPSGIGDTPIWKKSVGDILSWHDRLATVGSGSFQVDDLRPLQARMESLRELLGNLPVLSWIMLCYQHFTPEACSLPFTDDETERKRYARCLDHLLSLLDQQFGDESVTLSRVLEWIRLQIATNRSEDEPIEADDLEGKTVALTVHKSKGLEFDYVLIPYTWKQFGQSQTRKTEVVIQPQQQGLPRVVWKWEPDKEHTYTNTSVNDPAWGYEIGEVTKEEARLLYVAMTRAREKLEMFVPQKYSPNTWSEWIRQVAN